MNGIDHKHYFALATINPAKEDILLMKILILLVSRAGSVSKQNWKHVNSIALYKKLIILSPLKHLG